MEFLFENASFQWRGKNVIDNLTGFLANQSYLITGEIGSGKSMLLQAIGLKLSLSSGKREITEQGKLLSISDYHERVHLINSFSDQSLTESTNYYQQRYHSGMGEGVTLWNYLQQHGFRKEEESHRQLIKRSNLDACLDNYIFTLSNGQRKKMIFLRALLKQPKLLLLDNPFVGLDEESRQDLHHWLAYLHHQLGIQQFITCRKDEVPDFIHHEIILKKGAVEYIGQRKSNADSPSSDSLHLLSEIVKVCLQRKSIRRFDSILDMQNINVTYGGKPILSDLSWTVKQAERIALLGKNGSGKSTLLSLIYADNPLAYANHVFIFGHKRGTGESIWSIKKHMGFISPELHLYTNSNQTVEHIVYEGFFDNYSPHHKISAEDTQWILLLLRFVGLEDKKGQPFSTLSFGQQRLILFIRALAQVPELLLLDEPYQGLDWKEVEKCNKLLNAILMATKTSLIFTTHCKKEIPGAVDNYVYVENGRLTH